MSGSPNVRPPPNGKESGSPAKPPDEIPGQPPNEGNGPPVAASPVVKEPAVPPGQKILSLCQKGDWPGVEQVIRQLERAQAAGPPTLTNNVLAGIADEATGYTPLMYAVKENKVVIAERLIDLGANMNEKSKDDYTAFHLAAMTGKEEMLKMLINRRADATIPGGPKQQLPLHIVCARSAGCPVMLLQLLLRLSGRESRMTVDKDGNIPLFLAIEGGHLSMVKELLGQLGDSQVRYAKKVGPTGDTALHIGAKKHDLDMVRMLVEYGATVDVQNSEGQTIMHIASIDGDESLMKFLYQAKANPNIPDKQDRTPIHLAAEKGNTMVVDILADKFKASVFERTKDGNTLLHIACLNGHPETALAFLKKGVPFQMPNKAGARCIHTAARQGQVAVVNALLQKGEEVDSKTNDNYTALHIAVEACKPLVVEALLGHGAQVDLKGGKNGETPLHIAARVQGGEKCAEMLLKSGADVNSSGENGETSLHIAARYGHLKMVELLLEDGANPTCQSKTGESPLHIAVHHCHHPVADALLKFQSGGKSKEFATRLVNLQTGEGESAMHYAGEITKESVHTPNEDTDIIRLLLEFDGDVNLTTKATGETALHYCARAGNADVLTEIVNHISPSQMQTSMNKQAKAFEPLLDYAMKIVQRELDDEGVFYVMSVRVETRSGWSPLLVACDQGHLDVVKVLLQNHARVDVFDEFGKAALHLAAEKGHREVVDVLLQHKAFVNARSKIGVTPLHLAAMNGNNQLVRFLIEKHHAMMDALTLSKRTPLHLAAQNGQLEVCNTLLEMKADVNATDELGQTPLHLAAENDHSDVVKLFLKHRPELVSVANTNGFTCAHIAAMKGSEAVIKELMRFNKVVVTTARNKTSDSTPLHLAAEGGHDDVCKILLEAGASPTDENREGMTPLHLAAKFGHLEVLEVLRTAASGRVFSKKTGLTALHVAAQFGQTDVVRELLIQIPATIKSEAPASATESFFKETTHADSGLTPLHLASQFGHENIVRLLLNFPGVQVDAPSNVLGVTPLHMAAQGGFTAVSGLLLSKSTNQLHIPDKRGRTPLTLAATDGKYDMVAMLIGQGAEIDAADNGGMTALHYTAKQGHLNVVKLLVESGASSKSETKDGKIPLCFAAASGHNEIVSYLMKKEMNTYNLIEDKKFIFDLMVCGKNFDNKPIEEFILVSKAPVDIAAKLARNYMLLSTKEKDRAKDLEAASAYCENMAKELLAVAASMSSAGALLRAVDNRNIPFLDVLIENEQKEVVAHPAVQKYLTEVWMGNLRWGTWRIILMFLAFIFVFPVWIAFCLPLGHRYNKTPIIKFMSYLVSHVFFIVLLIITISVPVYKLVDRNNLIPNWPECMVLIWLSGNLVSELTNPGDRAGLGWLKVVILVVSAIGVTIHVVSLLVYTWKPLNLTVAEIIYIRNQFLGVSLLLSFTLLLDYLSFHYMFGPWAIIIRSLLSDLGRFLVILAIFMGGFTFQLSAVYQETRAPRKRNPTCTSSTATSLKRPMDSFEYLTLGMFGMIDPANIPCTELCPSMAGSIFKVVIRIYLVVTLIVLINLLIAMLSDTYQRIQAQSDLEWKFGRAKLIRNMNKMLPTPSPLNLLTQWIYCIYVLCKYRGKVCGKQGRSLRKPEDDTLSETRSVDASRAAVSRTARSQNARKNWGKAWRRGVQVAPSDNSYSVPRRQTSQVGPARLETVVDWHAVIKKYLALLGSNQSDDDNKEAE